MHQLKSGLKRTINQNKYQSKVTIQPSNPLLDYQVNPNFQRVNRLFIFSFENNENREGHTWYFLPKVEKKDYNVMIDEQNFLD